MLRTDEGFAILKVLEQIEELLKDLVYRQEDQHFYAYIVRRVRDRLTGPLSDIGEKGIRALTWAHREDRRRFLHAKTSEIVYFIRNTDLLTDVEKTIVAQVWGGTMTDDELIALGVP